MKKPLTILFFLIAANAFAQNKIITKYYDSVWAPATIEKASYYSVFEFKDSFYVGRSFYYPSNKLYSKFQSRDTIASKFFGPKFDFYEDGTPKDSIFYEQSGKLSLEYSYYQSGKRKSVTSYGNGWGIFDKKVYYENGNIWAHIYREQPNQEAQSAVFDSLGNLMPNYIYEKPAEFPGGIRGWTYYLERNLNRDIPYDKHAPNGKYTVYVTFTIDETGNVNNVIAENDPGYGCAEEAVRVIRKGPKWKPAIQYNKPVVDRHKQGITFQVSK